MLAGARKLRRTFQEKPRSSARRGDILVTDGERDAPALLIRNGFVLASCALANGRRAIIDVLVPGDLVGLDHLVFARPMVEIVAASRVSYSVLDLAGARALMTDPAVCLFLMQEMAQVRWRRDRLAVMLGRLDASAKMAAFLLNIHQRLRCRYLINGMSYNLPLIQEQIADHLGLTLVHVNRTLRRLREQRLAIVDRGVVIIMDYDGLHDLVRGLPEPGYVPDVSLENGERTLDAPEKIVERTRQAARQPPVPNYRERSTI